MNIRFAFLGLAVIGCGAPVMTTEDKGETSSHIEGGRLTPAEIARVAHQAGVPCGDKLVTAVAVGLGESDGVEQATHSNTDGSIDRGVWQINSRAWPEYPEKCTFDAVCNAGAMVDISGGGSNWQPWLAFTNQRYQQFLSDARAAEATECNGGGGGGAAPPAKKPTPSSRAECESIGYDGVCVGQTSIWAEDGACRVRDCASEGKVCGLISPEIGLGCKGGSAGAKVSDCSSFGAEGRCFGTTKVWVEQGQCRWATMPGSCQSKAAF